MRLRLFRSLWGLEGEVMHRFPTLPDLLHELKALGYSGVEASLPDLGECRRRLVARGRGNGAGAAGSQEGIEDRGVKRIGEAWDRSGGRRGEEPRVRDSPTDLYMRV